MNPLLQLRTKAGLEQQQLADLSGVDKSIISKLENNKTKAKLTTLAKITKALDKPVEELLELAIKVTPLLLMRAKAGLEQQQLADLSGVDISTIRDLENNKTKAYLSTLGKLANACNGSIEDLMELASSKETLQKRGKKAITARYAKQQTVFVGELAG